VLKNRRWQGWHDALVAAGVDPPESWAMAHGGIDGFEAGSLWLAQHLADWPAETRPTAMLIINDYAALIFTAAAQAHGLHVPNDLSVIGWDNLPVAAYGRVPLTTMAHPVLGLADRTIQTLGRRLQNDRSIPETIHLPGELIERSSVAPVVC
jgi:DNA-binding LacI/PurR family transcriptional regulator